MLWRNWLFSLLVRRSAWRNRRRAGWSGARRAARRRSAVPLTAVELLEDRTLLSASLDPFSAPHVLSNDGVSDTANETAPQLATDGAGHWVAVWSVSAGGVYGSDSDIFVAYSSDSGATWSAPAPLNTNAASDTGADTAPQIATDGTRWVTVWQSTNSLGGTIGTDSDILFSVSTDFGRTWSAPKALNSSASTDTVEDQIPQIATDGSGNWICAWRSFEITGPFQMRDEILVSRSTNNTATWSAAVSLSSNGVTDNASDTNPAIASDGGNNWVVVWESQNTLGNTIGSDVDILFSRSTNDGASWSTPAALNSTAASDTANDSSPEIAADGAGRWVTVWRSVDASGFNSQKDDILLARSTNGGRSWGAAVALTSSSPSDPGNDSSPHVATNGQGTWFVFWDSTNDLQGTVGSDKDIFFVRSTDNGQNWSSPAVLNGNAASDSGDDVQPRAACVGNTWLVLWQSKDSLNNTIGTDQDVLFVRSTNGGQTFTQPAALNRNAGSVAGADLTPHVVEGNGRWLAVWGSDTDLGGATGTDKDIFLSYSTDSGQTWSDVTALNTNAASDSGDDVLPRLATDGAGHWVAVWQSTDSLGGTIGTDADILFAYSSDNGQTWSAPAALNSDAASDSVDDLTPDIATNGSGQWIVVWRTSGTNGGLTSFDSIVVARSTDNGHTWSAPVTVSRAGDPDPRVETATPASPPTAVAGGSSCGTRPTRSAKASAPTATFFTSPRPTTD